MEISLSEGQWLECRCVNSRGSSTLLVRTSEPSAGSGADSADFEVDFEDGSSPIVDEEVVNLDLKITVEEDKILVDWAIDSSRDFMNLNYFLLDGKVFVTKQSDRGRSYLDLSEYFYFRWLKIKPLFLSQ